MTARARDLRLHAMATAIAVVTLAHLAGAWLLWHAGATGLAARHVDHEERALVLVCLEEVRPGPRRRGTGPAARVPALAPVPAPNAADTPAPAPPSRTTRFLGPDEVDLAPRPRSAPDNTPLQGLDWSGLPLRLRVFIDAQGAVVDVEALSSHEQAFVLERVRRMFLDTAFVPARARGVDVASYRDIELDLSPVVAGS